MDLRERLIPYDLPAQFADPPTPARIVRFHRRIENQPHCVHNTPPTKTGTLPDAGDGPVSPTRLRNVAISRDRATDNIRKGLRACTHHARRALQALLHPHTRRSNLTNQGQ